MSDSSPGPVSKRFKPSTNSDENLITDNYKDAMDKGHPTIKNFSDFKEYLNTTKQKKKGQVNDNFLTPLLNYVKNLEIENHRLRLSTSPTVPISSPTSINNGSTYATVARKNSAPQEIIDLKHRLSNIPTRIYVKSADIIKNKTKITDNTIRMTRKNSNNTRFFRDAEDLSLSTTENCDKLLETLENQQIKARVLKKRDPAISIRHLPDCVSSVDLMSAVSNLNIPAKFTFFTKPYNNEESAVLRLEPQYVPNLPRHLIILNMICPISLFISPNKCNTCKQFGHSTKFCQPNSYMTNDFQTAFMKALFRTDLTYISTDQLFNVLKANKIDISSLSNTTKKKV